MGRARRLVSGTVSNWGCVITLGACGGPSCPDEPEPIRAHTDATATENTLSPGSNGVGPSADAPPREQVGFECVTRLHVEASPAGALPKKLVDLLSLEGQTRLRECTACNGVAALHAKYLSQYTQAFCGVASSVMVLNSSSAAKPVTPPYAPYAFYTQCNVFNEEARRHIDIVTVEEQGMTLAQTTWLLNAQPGVTATCYHANTLTDGATSQASETSIDTDTSARSVATSVTVSAPPPCAGFASGEEFMALAKSTLEAPNSYLIANFSRAPLSDDGQGGGHFSPVGAYHAASDSFLVFDVARYKYPPFWVKANDLWSALDTVDSGSNTTRGFIVVNTR